MSTPTPNLVILLLDAARRDRFGCYGSPRGLTPAIDDFAREATLFEHMITPGPWTLPSHGSLFTGLYPREHGAQYPTYLLRRDVPTLAQYLAGRGYATIALSNNGALQGPVDLLRGFSLVWSGNAGPRYLRRVRSRVRKVLGGDARAAVTGERFAALLPELRRPFLVFVNLMETHWPYSPTRPFERRLLARRLSLLGGTLHRFRRLRYGSWHFWATHPNGSAAYALLNDIYDAALAYVDSQVGRFLEVLTTQGRRDDTIVMVLADHGENIGTHGLGHQGALNSALIAVPCIVRVPGRGGYRDPRLLQFTDVFSGLCRLLGFPLPDHLARRQGPDMFDRGGPGREYAFAEWARWRAEVGETLRRRFPGIDFAAFPELMVSVQDLRYKLVEHRNPPSAFLYELGRDPDETADLIAQRPEEAARLRRGLAEWERSMQPEGQAYRAEETAAVEERLKALGYI